MLRRTDHSLADQAIVRLGPLRRQSIEPLSQGQSDALLAAVDAKGPQAPERAQLVLGIVKALRDLKGLCPNLADLGNGTSGIHQRRAQCGEELHLALRVPARPRRASGEPMLAPAAALLYERQMHPQGNRGGSQCHADRGVTARRKGPVEWRAQIVDSWAVLCQPFVGWPRLRLRLGAFKKVPIAFGVASRCRVELAGLNELLERIISGGFEQAIAYCRAASVRSHERFRDQVRNAIDDVQRRNRVNCYYRTRSLQREAASEDCQATQQHALGFGQQLVAPVERRSQCLMTGQCGPAAAREEPEPVVEPGR